MSQRLAGRERTVHTSPSELLAAHLTRQCDKGLHTWAAPLHENHPNIRNLQCLVCMSLVALPIDNDGRVVSEHSVGS